MLEFLILFLSVFNFFPLPYLFVLIPFFIISIPHLVLIYLFYLILFLDSTTMTSSALVKQQWQMFLKLCREGRLSVRQKNMISICLSIVMDLRTDDCKYVRLLSIIDERFNLFTFLKYIFLLNFSTKRFVFLFLLIRFFLIYHATIIFIFHVVFCPYLYSYFYFHRFVFCCTIIISPHILQLILLRHKLLEHFIHIIFLPISSI